MAKEFNRSLRRSNESFRGPPNPILGGLILFFVLDRVFFERLYKEQKKQKEKK